MRPLQPRRRIRLRLAAGSAARRQRQDPRGGHTSWQRPAQGNGMQRQCPPPLGRSQRRTSLSVPGRALPVAVLGVLGRQPAMRASGLAAAPLRCDSLRDIGAAEDTTKRSCQVWGEGLGLEQASRRPSVNAAGQMGKAWPASSNSAALGAAPGSEEDALSGAPRPICGPPAVWRRRHAAPALHVGAKPELPQAAQGGGHRPDGATSTGGDGRGRSSPHCEVDPTSPQRPCRLQHRCEDHDLLRVQAPRGAEDPEHYLRGCAPATVNGILSCTAQVL